MGIYIIISSPLFLYSLHLLDARYSKMAHVVQFWVMQF